MLFQVIATHSWETCEGNSSNPSPMAERQRWVEGNEEVRVIGAWGNHLRHTHFAVVEANDYDAIHELLRPQGLKGTVEVLPVGDLISTRRASGNWGK